jgi:hypothetical protein
LNNNYLIFFFQSIVMYRKKTDKRWIERRISGN